MKLEDLDKNFIVPTKLEEKDLVFRNIKDKPFDLYGVYKSEKGKPFIRIPDELAEETVSFLAKYCAGVRVRFKTDSPYVAISIKYEDCHKMPHMPLSGSGGADMYICENHKYTYVKTFIPPVDVDNSGYESIHYFDNRELKDLTINLPIYSSVEEFYIGVAENSTLTCGDKYINEKPIVYYGSSITHGGCASTPGNIYEGIISRHFDFDYMNLGFPGSARAEKSMAEYISNLDMSCFVYDYDHNAPDVEYLKSTHKPMFDIIRRKHPDIPIIMLSAPICTIWTREDQAKRKEVVRQTYFDAKSQGDENVYFIEGDEMYDSMEGINCSVDGCHPTDLGFMCMAQSIIEVMKKIF